jgi:hypothetical protein
MKNLIVLSKFISFESFTESFTSNDLSIEKFEVVTSNNKMDQNPEKIFVISLAELNEVSEMLSNTSITVFYSSVENVVSEALGSIPDINGLLSEWQVEAGRLITFYTKNRKNTTVLNFDDFCTNLVKNCEQIEVLSTFRQLGTSKLKPQELLSLVYFQQNPLPSALVGDLEAITTPIEGDKHLMIDLNELNKQLLDWRSIESSLSEENKLILLQLHQLQDKLEKELLSKESEQIKIKEIEAKLNQQINSLQQINKEKLELQREYDKQKEELSRVQQENELIILQLHQVQEELEVLYLEKMEEQKNKVNTSAAHTEEITDAVLIKEYPLLPVVAYFKPLGKFNKKELQVLFDKEWFNQKYGKKYNPFRYFMKKGWKQNQNPHPLFDVEFYLAHNNLENIAQSPLLHFMAGGGQFGYSPHPLFNCQWYLEQNPDVKESGINPLLHYLTYGANEGRNPNPIFDSKWYLETNPDVKESGVNPLVHYVEYGSKEGRNPAAMFNINTYLEINSDVKEGGQEPLAHYLLHGWREKRSISS